MHRPVKGFPQVKKYRMHVNSKDNVGKLMRVIYGR